MKYGVNRVTLVGNVGNTILHREWLKLLGINNGQCLEVNLLCTDSGSGKLTEQFIFKGMRDSPIGVPKG